MYQNQNYYDRLLEAYNAIKEAGINTLEQFMTKENIFPLEAFTYYEITIFDRIKDEEYKRSINDAWFEINNHTQEYINDKYIDNRLASWGKLGNTPYRDEMILKGLITVGLTEEESAKYFGK